MTFVEKKSRKSYCRALAHIRVSNEACPVVPIAGIIGLAVLLLTVIAGLGVSEMFVRSKRGASILKHKPSPDWERENAVINENNRGKIKTADFWHSEAHPYRPKSTAKRILVMGDSFVWGDGNVNMNEIWWRQLQWELNRRGYWDVDVVGSGSYGGSTEAEFHALRDADLIEKSGADLVIVGYVTNDPILTTNPIRQLSGEPLEKLRNAYRSIFVDRVVSFFFPNIGEVLQDRIVNKKFYKRTAGPNVAFPYSIWRLKLLHSENLRLYKELLVKFGEFIRAKDTPLFFMTLPNTPLKEQYSVCYKPLIPLFENAEIPFHNILKDFLRKYPGVIDPHPWFVNPANGHPGPISTHFYAQRAADIIEQEYSEALGDKSPVPRVVEPRINDWVPYNLMVDHVGGGQWTVRFPTNEMLPLYMPLKQPHVMLSFEYPISATQITLSGNLLSGADLHLEAINNEKGFNTGELHPLGTRTGAALTWECGEEPFTRHMTALRIVPAMDPEQFRKGNRSFQLKIEGAKVAMLP